MNGQKPPRSSTLTPLGDDRFEQISDSKAKYEYWLKKQGDMAGQYSKNVSEVLKDWRKSVEKGEFIIYWEDAPTGKRVPTLDALYSSSIGTFCRPRLENSAK